MDETILGAAPAALLCRAKAKEDFLVTFDHQLLNIKKGEVLEGALASYLIAAGAPVQDATPKLKAAGGANDGANANTGDK